MRYLINLIITHFLTGSALFFASGPVILPGMGGGETLPPPAEGGGTEGESGEELVETDGSEGTEEDGTEADGTPKTTPTADKDAKIDWRTIPQDVKAHIQAISKDNPKLGNALQNAVYTSQTFLKEFPGGLKEAQTLKHEIEEVGGLEEVKSLRTNFQTMQEEQEVLDSKARSGDSSVLDNLMEIAGEGFSKLMPTALDKWSASDPDNYGHIMGKVMVNAMQEAGVVADLNLAFKMLNLNNPDATKLAIESLQKVASWVNGVGKIAAKVPQKAAVDPKIAQQTQDLENQRAQIFNEKFSGEFGNWRNSKIREQVSVVAPDKKLSDYQMETLGTRVISEMRSILESDPEYMKNLERIYNTRNMAELLKFAKSRTEKLLPEVTKKAYRALFGVVTPINKKKVTAKPTQAAGTGAQTTTQGWVKVSPDKAPDPSLIDNKKTDFKMKFNKQAILIDGKKVYWGDKVPQ